VTSWATERARGGQLGSPPLPNALGDLLIHHPPLTNLRVATRHGRRHRPPATAGRRRSRDNGISGLIEPNR
jgi:hypothetical protein